MSFGIFGDLHAHVGATRPASRPSDEELKHRIRDEVWRLFVAEFNRSLIFVRGGDLYSSLMLALDEYDEIRKALEVKS